MIWYLNGSCNRPKKVWQHCMELSNHLISRSKIDSVPCPGCSCFIWDRSSLQKRDPSSCFCLDEVIVFQPWHIVSSVMKLGRTLMRRMIIGRRQEVLKVCSNSFKCFTTSHSVDITLERCFWPAHLGLSTWKANKGCLQALFATSWCTGDFKCFS